MNLLIALQIGGQSESVHANVCLWFGGVGVKMKTNGSSVSVADWQLK